jgi:hypothetical protein
VGGEVPRLEARVKSTIGALLFALPLAALAQFDHSHAAWTALLKRHVVLLAGASASQVDYAGLARERAALKNYLDSLSRVTAAEFGGWGRLQRMAFLVNAYNAWTVEKILTRYPRLKSIRDFGTVFGNPWKDRFFTLFGKECHLDRIEHEMLRAPGAYDEPRVHYALNCASVGCPMLREEAYVAARLDVQLEAQARRFLSDRSRNRYDSAKSALEVSRIFDWYQEDWSSSFRGIGADAPPIDSLPHYFSRYAGLLADDPAQRKLIAEQKVGIAYLDYDWGLNDITR